jgi:hypothetical protein
MFDWFRKRGLQNRAIEYVRRFPDDEPAAKAIIVARQTLAVDSAREAAEITFGRAMSDEEWATYGPRWQRAWDAIVGQG